MCIIVHKGSGVEMPSNDILQNCWDNNGDGAGFMYRGVDNEIFIRKGFMKDTEFFDAFNSQKFTKEDNVVIHFRIKTHGKKDGSNTHPFPITSDISDLKEEFLESPMAIAHNGTISEYGDDEHSDTMLFIRDFLSKRKIARGLINKTPKILNKIKEKIGVSRIIVMTPNDTLRLGAWVEKDGVYYSNKSYETRRYSWTHMYNTKISNTEVLEKCFMYNMIRMAFAKRKIIVGRDIAHDEIIKIVNDMYITQKYRFALTQSGRNISEYSTSTKVKNAFENTAEKMPLSMYYY